MDNILTKRQAEKAITDSLFTPDGTLACRKKVRWDGGKYEKTIIGKPHTYGRIIWAERRQDKHGPFYALFTFDDA